ncbi:MAG TPA: RagB/SusD family nutrient uptake outer membrane protein [Prolixibacteraceae bacterium]|nr:RagB/SusD family nutrient uptake outer membrane protein [Prolixibacteraceae bacterium]
MKRTLTKIQLGFVALILFFATSSCNDWLYLKPEDGVLVDEFWQSQADLEAGLMGCYASMLGNNVGGSMSVSELMLLWGEIRGDMLTYYNEQVNDYMLVWQGDIKPYNSFCKWSSFYRTINYCNTVLEKGGPILSLDPSFTEDEWNQYRAEALAIRALMYFYLTRVFDEVPLVLDATTNDLQVITQPKASRETIWAQIEADLAEAEKYICFTYNAAPEVDKGRITKHTVWALQADFYLWTEEYAKSESACDKVIQSGKFWLVDGNMEWITNLYVLGNSPEGIFELQFDVDILNPYFNLFYTNANYRAHPDVMEYFWPTDPYLVDADSADIRSDRGSYRSGMNYAIWKYIGRSRTELKSPSEAYSNFIVYRYADILLMKAEAIAAGLESDDPVRGSEALALIQQVRRRAKASVLTDEGEETSKEALLMYVLKERAREFAFEGKRWFDILRYAKRDNYKRIQTLKNMYQLCAPSTKLLSIQSKLNDPNSHYLPIPQSDIDASNEQLVQNPFYEE